MLVFTIGLRPSVPWALLVAAFSLLGATACTGNASESSESSQHDRPLEYAQCEEACSGSYSGTVESCVSDCQQQRTAASLPLDGTCAEYCETGGFQRAVELHERRCVAACVSDPDGDGVGKSADLCPETVPEVLVNARGCRDSDGDGIEDREDDCPEDGEEPLTTRGCPVSTKGECCAVDGNGCCTGTGSDCPVDGSECCVLPPESCEPDQTVCNGSRECLAALETPIPTSISEHYRSMLAEQLAKVRSHPRRCEEDFTGPAQPRMIAPAPGIETRVYPSENWVEIKNGQVDRGSVARTTFEWEAVTDPCEPVNYSLQLEIYHCHAYRGERNLNIYRRKGWCEWQTFDYVDAGASTTVTIDLPLGVLLYNLHHDFVAPDPPHWGRENAIITNGWAPTWIRGTVVAHDANGSASRFGLHGHQSHLVFHRENVARERLQRIPRVPWLEPGD